MADSELYGNPHTASELIVEHEDYGAAKAAPVKFDSQIGFPYTHLPSSRDFERLLYCIYEHDETKQQLGAFYDTAILMQGSSERGRDLLLTANGTAVGLVQAKQYKSNLSRNELGREIIKFVLHATQDNKLMPSDAQQFHYYIAVSCGLAEKAGDLIGEINSNTLDENELTGWVESVVNKNLALSKLTYEAIKTELNKYLAIMHVTQVIPTDLDNCLASPAYSNIVQLFFRVTPVIDVGTFEEMLVSREAEKIEFDASLSLLEKRLQQVDGQLFAVLTEIKSKVFECYNEFSHQCLTTSNHRKVHHSSLIKILSQTVLGKQLIEDLNKHELFILSASAFLTDIGICADFEVLEEQLQITKKAQAFRGITNKIRISHHKLSADCILKIKIIPDQYKKAIALVAGVGFEDIQDILSHPEELSIEPFEREKACIPLLSYSLLIADMIDIQSLTSDYLFARHKHLEGIQEAVAVWEEAPPKLQVEPTEDGKRLELKGTVTNQLVHLSLLEHLKSVQLVLSRAHESLRRQSAVRQLATVFADYKVTSPFVENFGFSVAEENVLATFIEKSMYTNELMALRELIQNAIDSCLLRKKQPNSDYSPEIHVQIYDKSVTVSDNGMGMDRHDVEFYFSRLGRSFYKENSVANSIGQFGVGVFAYFMMADSFEVTTKADTDVSLSFIASPNAPYCFYFSPNNTEKQGTTVELALKVEYQGIVEELVDYVISTFRHTAIPVFVKDETSVTEVMSPGFRFSKQEVIESFVKPPFRRQFNNFSFTQVAIESPEFDGACGIFDPGRYDDGDFDLRRKSTGCKIFQNGVFVCSFSNLIGEINIKQPLLLKANREGFENNKELQSIISHFQRSILKKVAPKLPADIERMKFTRFYLYNYQGTAERDALLLEAEFHSILAAIDDGTNDPVLLSHQELSHYAAIGLIHVDCGGFAEKQMFALSSILKIPCVCVASMMDTNCLREYLKVTGFGFKLYNANEMSFLLAMKDMPPHQGNYSVKQSVILPFFDKTICSYLVNLGDSEYLNSEHPILRSVEERFDELRKNRRLAKAAETFFDTLVDQLRNAYPSYQMVGHNFNLPVLQHYLGELNNELGTTHSLSVSDFPHWMHEKILV